MKTTRIMFTAVSLLLLLVAFSCAPQAVPAPPAPAPAPGAEAGAPVTRAMPAAWEQDWEKTVAGAKKEGRVVAYGIPMEARVLLSQGIKERYGLNLESITGRGAEVAEKLLSERRGGLRIADIYIGGATTATMQLKPGGAFVPPEPALVLPEVMDPKVWWGGGMRFIDRERSVLAFISYAQVPLFINTEMVKPDEIKTYRDLLNPKWKGKLAMNDPSVAGPGLRWFAVTGESIMGWDFMRELAKQEPVVLRDQRLQVEWVARGKYPVGIAPFPPPLTDFKKAGAPIMQLTPVEGTYMTSGHGVIGLIKEAAHPDAAKLFLNWFLTKEGQTLYSRGYGTPSGRLDVPTEHLDPLTLLDPKVKYYSSDNEEFMQKQPEHIRMAKEIFGPLMK